LDHSNYTYFGLNTKLKVIHLCKGSGSSKIGTGRQYGQISPLFTNPETKDKISSVTQYVGKLLQKQMSNTENGNLETMCFEWFHKERPHATTNAQ
jgi:hypothetical protein